jgi:hypothetical protein
MGNYFVSSAHLILIFRKWHKIDHKLLLSDLNCDQRMNYQSITRIASTRILNLLKSIENTEGTAAFIELMIFYRSAYIDPNTPTQDRVFYAVFTAIFLRTWRQYLMDNKMKISANFITTNTFNGIELNLIWLLGLVVQQREQNITKLSSQVCESTFRIIRSLTGMRFTDVNCSAKSFAERVQKIEVADRITRDLSGNLTFPTYNKKNSINEAKPSNLSYEDLIITIESASFAATQRAKELGMSCEEVKLEKMIREIVCNENDQLEYEEEQIIEAFGEDEEDIDKLLVYQNVQFMSEATQNAFLYLKVDGEVKKVHKRQLLYMLENDKLKLSNDISRRFITTRMQPPIDALSSSTINDGVRYWQSIQITKGDSIFIISQDDKTIKFGTVLNFKYYNEKSISRSKHPHHSINLEEVHGKKLGVFLFPCKTLRNGRAKKYDLNDHFYDASNYLCHFSKDLIFNHEFLSFIENKFTAKLRS